LPSVRFALVKNLTQRHLDGGSALPYPATGFAGCPHRDWGRRGAGRGGTRLRGVGEGSRKRGSFGIKAEKVVGEGRKS